MAGASLDGISIRKLKSENLGVVLLKGEWIQTGDASGQNGVDAAVSHDGGRERSFKDPPVRALNTGFKIRPGLSVRRGGAAPVGSLESRSVWPTAPHFVPGKPLPLAKVTFGQIRHYDDVPGWEQQRRCIQRSPKRARIDDLRL
jgi:hypothetical protein